MSVTGTATARQPDSTPVRVVCAVVSGTMFCVVRATLFANAPIPAASGRTSPAGMRLIASWSSITLVPCCPAVRPLMVA